MSNPSRFATSSAHTRQWLTECYADLLDEPQREARNSQLLRRILDAFVDGELAAAEYIESIMGPAVKTLEAELCMKFATADVDGGTGCKAGPTGTQEPGAGPTGTAPPGTIIPPQPGPLAPPQGPPSTPGPGLWFGPEQLALLPLDLIQARRVEVARRIAAIKTEDKRLREVERESREFRGLMRDQLPDLVAQLKTLEKAVTVFKQAASDTEAMAKLAEMGIGAEDLGLGDLASMFKEEAACPQS
ncbi:MULTISPECIES: hypothetical protein [Streptacidiphilus]|uniref:Uncharacterized protein n=1 Tax=Streptacidiphilus cavernicola TaxID=3342716 RepID=A0ABV6V086_9ACTN|nr:hypothetical protein [Streptacidiphilus jeojiense]